MLLGSAMRTSAERASALARAEMTRVVEDTIRFHAGAKTSVFDALALEDALELELQESGKLAQLRMQMEALGVTTSKRVRGLVLVGPKHAETKLLINETLHAFAHRLPRTRRETYGAFMQASMHRLLEFRKNEELALRDPMPYLIHQVVKEEGVKLLIVEDVVVTSLMEAMLLRRFFKGLFGYGLGIVLTTTRPPSTWYAHGVNSHKLEEFKTLIKHECEMIRMD